MTRLINNDVMINKKLKGIEKITGGVVALSGSLSSDGTVLEVYDTRTGKLFCDGSPDKLLGRLADLEFDLDSLYRQGYKITYNK